MCHFPLKLFLFGSQARMLVCNDRLQTVNAPVYYFFELNDFGIDALLELGAAGLEFFGMEFV